MAKEDENLSLEAPSGDVVFEKLSKLSVSVARSADITPEDSPSGTALDNELRQWLNVALGSSGATVRDQSPGFRLYVKLLVSNAAAGSIIGKAGGNINEFQAKTFSRIQLSKSGEYYPGTAERTLLVSGRLKQVIAALALVFAKLLREGVAPLSPRSRAVADAREAGEELEADRDTVPRLAVKLLVPQPLCGIIIGKQGATVRALSTETDTSIRVTAPEGPALGLNHRVVTVAGTTDACLKAIALLVLKQAEDPKFGMFSELPSTYGAAAGAGAAYAAAGAHGAYGGGASPYPAGAGGYGQGLYTAGPDGMATMAFPLPEEQAAVLRGHGRGSGGVEDLQAATGVRITIVESPATPPGAGRDGQAAAGAGGAGPSGAGPGVAQVTVVGPAEGVQYANYLMAQRLAMAMMHHQYMASHAAAGGGATAAAAGAWYPHHGYAQPAMHPHPHHAYAAAAAGHHHQYGVPIPAAGRQGYPAQPPPPPPGAPHSHYQQQQQQTYYGGGAVEGDGRRPSPRTVVLPQPPSSRAER